MDAQDIKNMFVGISEYTKDIIARKLKKHLAGAIFNVNKDLTANGLSVHELCPRVENVMGAFRLCPLEKVVVLVLGQDPYIKRGEADGKSFSVPRGVSVPPSLRNMYASWIQSGFLKTKPTHGDLTAIAQQGVLFLNAALTTQLGTSNAHADCWSEYTDKLIEEISALPQSIIFIALGGFAKKKIHEHVDKRRHVILEWGHPSPMNPANKKNNPMHFRNCTAFKRTNDLLILAGKQPIVWDPDYTPRENVLEECVVPCNNEPIARADAPMQPVNKIKAVEFKEQLKLPTLHTVPPTVQQLPHTQLPLTQLPLTQLPRAVGADDPCPTTMDTLWIFTDGGATGNGSVHCKASYAFYITDGCMVACAGGRVVEVDIPGQKYRTSNQRGELTAILEALKYINANADEFSFKRCIIVTDSKYSINCITDWINNWIAMGKLAEKANIDLILQAKDLYDKLQSTINIEFQHMRSHEDAPLDDTSEEYFKWKCNDIVDKICGIYTQTQT